MNIDDDKGIEPSRANNASKPTTNLKRKVGCFFIYGCLTLIAIIAAPHIFNYIYLVTEKPAPVRNFSTSQLLISSLPGWGIYEGPIDEPPYDIELDNGIGESDIRFLRAPAGIGQWAPDEFNNPSWEPVSDMTQYVDKFTKIGYAAQAYKNNEGSLRDKPEPLNGFYYTSKVANQFRVVCDAPVPTAPQAPLGVQEIRICYVEGQYDEFYTYVIYTIDNLNDPTSDLEAISKAMDSKMLEFLGYKN